MSSPLFELGRIVATPGALGRIERRDIDAAQLLGRHIRGDWGDVSPEDASENDLAVRAGFRLLSSYGYDDGKLWIATEADRSATTILRPEDY